jgi:nucleoside-diphosphate-sugar epimerase
MMLITGGTGFLGKQIVRAAHERGVPMRVVTRKLEREAGVEYVQTQDVFSESADWWKKALEGVDTVIHAAWYAEPGKCLTSPRNLDCLQGTLVLAKACAESNIRRFVGVGTCFEYDLQGGLLDITTPLRPETLYAASKASTFLTLHAYFPAVGVSFAWVRPFYLFGEGEDARRLFPYLHQRLAAGEPAELTRGNQIRDYLDVTEAGRMIYEVAASSTTGPTNICSGVPVTVRQMAENIADQYGRRTLLRFGARPDNLTDPACVVGRAFQKTSDAN